MAGFGLFALVPHLRDRGSSFQVEVLSARHRYRAVFFLPWGSWNAGGASVRSGVLTQRGEGTADLHDLCFPN